MNCFDGTLVILSMFEIVLSNNWDGTHKSKSAFGAFRSVRIFRTFRVLRVIKLIRSLKFMKIIINVIS